MNIKTLTILCAAMLVAVWLAGVAAAAEPGLTFVKDVRELMAGDNEDEARTAIEQKAREAALQKAANYYKTLAVSNSLSRKDVAEVLGRLFEPETVDERRFSTRRGDGYVFKVEVATDRGVYEEYVRELVYNRKHGKADPEVPAEAAPVTVVVADPAMPTQPLPVDEVNPLQGTLPVETFSLQAPVNATLAVTNGTIPAEYMEHVQSETATPYADTASQQSAFDYTHEARLLYKAGKYEDAGAAEEMLEKAIVRDPNSAVAHNNLGAALQEQGKYEKAVEQYSKAIELNPGEAMYYNNRGHALHMHGDYLNAIKDYSSALKADPGYALAYSNRGYAFNKLGKYSRMCRDFRAACDLGRCGAKEQADLVGACQ